MEAPTITADELNRLRREGAGPLILDVRTPAEFNEVHAEGARLMPLDQLDCEAVRAATLDQTVYTICRTGSRARQAAQKLAAAGVPAVPVEGGTLAWESAGLPVKRGRKAMSLERQVRIAAGSLVLIGVLLGYLVHAGFLILSGFVGAGLVFAGVTDFCGMAMVLGRMPWNQAHVDEREMFKPVTGAASASAARAGA